MSARPRGGTTAFSPGCGQWIRETQKIHRPQLRANALLCCIQRWINVLYRVGDYTSKSVNQEMPLTHY